MSDDPTKPDLWDKLNIHMAFMITPIAIYMGLSDTIGFFALLLLPVFVRVYWVLWFKMNLHLWDHIWRKK